MLTLARCGGHALKTTTTQHSRSPPSVCQLRSVGGPPSRCKTAVSSWYEGVGHMPFIEDAERFNRELAAFIDRARE